MMELIDCGRLWAWLWLPSLLQPCLENRRTVLSLTFHLFIPERCTQLFSPGTFCWFFLLCKVEKKTFFGGWLLTTDESVGENGWRTHTKEATRSRGIITVKLLLRVPANYWLNKWTTRSSFSLWSFRTLNVVIWQERKPQLKKRSDSKNKKSAADKSMFFIKLKSKYHRPCHSDYP